MNLHPQKCPGVAETTRGADDTKRMVNIMVKVTLNDNLVPSTRDLWVRDRPHSDLTNHYDHAKRLIRAACQFFHLTRNAVIFSGYIQDEPGFFVINLWHEGNRVRSLVLSSLGYSGVLHADTIGGSFEAVVGLDLLGAIARGSNLTLSAAVA
jgi:hypothetical protein